MFLQVMDDVWSDASSTCGFHLDFDEGEIEHDNSDQASVDSDGSNGIPSDSEEDLACLLTSDSSASFFDSDMDRGRLLDKTMLV